MLLVENKSELCKEHGKKEQMSEIAIFYKLFILTRDPRIEFIFLLNLK